ncbi:MULTISPECIES: YoaH family protein [Photobacterium]|uniref:YoaH family protein n=1 Tax=Photobacterium lipolyticum TaxID=266810 RepID=A0A2T3MZL7_9GAMM|nr:MULTISPECIES: YoaH family protein [Photobacterium]MDX1302827.1 YoaH family protein [Photobacterium sp.]PSW05366.1 YoaH family protein [Photobacterium lipolyticum]
MFNNVPTLNHEEQQKAADRIHEFMANGMSSGEAILIVANEIREAAAKKQAEQTSEEE